MSFLNEVKNLHYIVRKGIRDSSLSLRMIPMYREDFLRNHHDYYMTLTTNVLLIEDNPGDARHIYSENPLSNSAHP